MSNAEPVAKTEQAATSSEEVGVLKFTSSSDVANPDPVTTPAPVPETIVRTSASSIKVETKSSPKTTSVKTDTEKSAPKTTSVKTDTEKSVPKTESAKSSVKPVAEPTQKEETVSKPVTTTEYTSSSSSSSKSKYSSKPSKGRKTYSDYMADFSSDYSGMSSSVLENISTHPVLLSRTYQYETPAYKLSARSKKVMREASDLGASSPGLKAMFEVEYFPFTISSCFFAESISAYFDACKFNTALYVAISKQILTNIILLLL